MTSTSIPATKGHGLADDADHSLIERALGGEHEAFARVVAMHQRYVAALAQRLLGWDPEVDDVVQDVFASVWQRRGQLRETERFRGWLARITVNTARTRLRRRMVRQTLLLNFGQTRPAEADESPVVGESLERQEAGRLVRDAVNRLPQRDKEVLVLHYLEHMPIDEVAGILGQRVNTVEVRLHRARKRLAERLPKELKP